MSGNDLGDIAIAYAHATSSPVLRVAAVLCSYARATPCPVLTWSTLVPGSRSRSTPTGSVP
eukprot:207680-Rhodomonas_salina.2